jgi:hypothetical protein
MPKAQDAVEAPLAEKVDLEIPPLDAPTPVEDVVEAPVVEEVTAVIPTEKLIGASIAPFVAETTGAASISFEDGRQFDIDPKTQTIAALTREQSN